MNRTITTNGGAGQAAITSIGLTVSKTKNAIAANFPLLNFLLGKGRKRTEGNLQHEFILTKNNSITMIDYDSDLPDGNTVVKQELFFTTALAASALKIRVGDLVVHNADKTRAYNLQNSSLDTAVKEFYQDLATKVYTGGTETIKPVSVEEILDDGTNYATYGGKARATYVDSTNPFRIGSKSIIGGNYLAAIGTLTKEIVRDFTLMAQQNVGNYAFYVSPDVYVIFENLYGTSNSFVNARVTDNGELSAGFSKVTVDGIVVNLDRGVPAGTFYLINLDDIGMDYYDISLGNLEGFNTGNETFVQMMNIPSTMEMAQKNTKFSGLPIYLVGRSRGNKLFHSFNLLMDFAVTAKFPSVHGLGKGVTA